MRKLLLATVITFCALAHGESPKNSDAPQHGSDATNTRKITPKGIGVSENAPVFVKVVPSNPGPYENEKRAAEDKKEAQKIETEQGLLHETVRLADYTKGLMWATIALFVFTALLFAVAVAQRKESREAIAAANRSADIAGKSLTHAQVSSQQQLRAYVLASGFGRAHLQDARMVVPLRLTNTGQTPAYEFQCAAHIGVFHYPLLETEILDQPLIGTEPSKSPMGANQFADQPISTDRQLTLEIIEALRREEIAVYVWGTATYRDIFLESHRTEFCFFITGPDIGPVGVYSSGNTAT